MEICKTELCTGCGMCTNLCPKKAITMHKGLHGFIYPTINEELCINCGLCNSRCPANQNTPSETNVKQFLAAWNRDIKVRKRSTSGGIFTILAEQILSCDGVVAGVKWDNNFCATHCIIESLDELYRVNGSKYVQSDTNSIYHDVKKVLSSGGKVLFSGTPCQNHALTMFLGKDYDNLIQVDLVCHGVPTYEMLNKYLDELKQSENGDAVSTVQLRYKHPYWDFCTVHVDFENGKQYEKLTVDDPYYTLFNIGYSLRERCRSCKYASLHRYGDITLADFWSFTPHDFKMGDYNKGVSLVMLNSEKGAELFDSIKDKTNYEVSTIDKAKSSNKSLSEPFSLPDDQVQNFWLDYENGNSVNDLCKKYVPNPYKVPNMINLRRLKRRYGWIFKR